MRDPTPSLIVSPSGMLRGCIWVSGLFEGFNAWCRDHKVGLTINALARGGGVILDMDNRRQPAESFRERVETCVRKIGESLGRGEAILIHCAHGIHRSGSFMVLILALFITLHDIYEGINSHTEWPHALEKAWEFWSTQRGLRLRSSHHHDYEQESWTAMQGFFGNLSESDGYGMAILLSRGHQQGTGTLSGTKQIINEVFNMMSVQSAQSLMSVQSEQSLQASQSVMSLQSAQKFWGPTPRRTSTRQRPRRSHA